MEEHCDDTLPRFKYGNRRHRPQQMPGTVNRIAEALGVEPIVALKSKKKADKNLIDYVMTVIVEFARRHDLTIREASNYIRRFKGIDFLTEFYDVEHTLSFNDCVDDLTIVCQNNGGTLR
jgi:hypothetical protein